MNLRCTLLIPSWKFRFNSDHEMRVGGDLFCRKYCIHDMSHVYLSSFLFLCVFLLKSDIRFKSIKVIILTKKSSCFTKKSDRLPLSFSVVFLNYWWVSLMTDRHAITRHKGVEMERLLQNQWLFWWTLCKEGMLLNIGLWRNRCKRE